MEIFAYNFTIITASAATVALIIGAIVAVAKARAWPTILQLIGAAASFASAVMQRLQLTHLERGRISPAWIWRTQSMLTGGGMLVFSIGFLWYWINRPDKPATETQS